MDEIWINYASTKTSLIIRRQRKSGMSKTWCPCYCKSQSVSKFERLDKNKSPSTIDDYEKLATPTNLVRLLPSSSSFEVAPFLYTVDLRMRSTQ